MATQNLLFSKDKDEKLKARKILAHVDLVMDSSYGVELISTCTDGCKTEDGASVSLSNAPNIERRIANTRHKNTCKEMETQLN